MNWTLLAGPLIGAIIGYFTNYIAVKMLFFPKTEKRLFGHKLPFTPGAIPKGKPRLAKAIGDVVGKTLLTKEDIEKRFTSDELLLPLADQLADKLETPIKDALVHTANLSEEQYAAGKENLNNKLCTEMADALSKMDLSEIIAQKGGDAVKAKVQGTMLAMFLSDELIRSVTDPIAVEIQRMIVAEGADYIKPYLAEKLDELEMQTVLNALGTMDISKEDIKAVFLSLVQTLVRPMIGKMMDALNISGIVEAKIEEMSVDQLEELVLTVMKKELNMIVNLGALIGFILGLLNLVI